MGRKGGLAALFSPRSSSRPSTSGGAPSPSPPWPWPSCATKPETASFRRHGGDDDERPCCTTAGARGGTRLIRPPRGKAAPGADEDVMYKTVNSVFFDDAAGSSCRSSLFDRDGREEEDAEEGLLDNGSFSTTTAAAEDEEWSEAVIRSLGRTSTDRFFFDAGPALPASPFTSTMARRTLAPPAEADAARTTQALPPSSKGAGLDCDESAESSEQQLQEHDDSGSESSDDCPGLLGTSSSASLVLEESVAVALDSADPFGDFRASMSEMVSAHGLRDWPALQEMLLWYLRINGKRNHALIVGAFVDLLVGLAATSSSNSVSGSSTATTATATATATTTTTTTAATTPCSSSDSSSTSTSSGGGVAAPRRHTAAATAAGLAAVQEQRAGGGTGSAGASCSSASSSSDLGEAAATAAGDGRGGIVR